MPLQLSNGSFRGMQTPSVGQGNKDSHLPKQVCPDLGKTSATNQQHRGNYTAIQTQDQNQTKLQPHIQTISVSSSSKHVSGIRKEDNV